MGIHKNSSGREVIEEAIESNLSIEKSNSFDDENFYADKDLEMSIDSNEEA